MIYDCFMFFNEDDILDIRLHELYDKVDWFVLAEQSYTHSGKEKPLFWRSFLIHDERFADVRDKVINLEIKSKPKKYRGSWDLENYHRNCIQRGIKQANDEDIVLISDCDEIPDLNRELPDFPFVFEQDYYCYYLNCKTPHKWKGTVATKKKYLNTLTPQDYRNSKDKLKSVEGGWHFGYIGDEQKIRAKLTSFAHTEYSDEHSIKKIINQYKNLKDPYQDVQFDITEDTKSLPKYVQNNKERFNHILCQN